MIKAIKFASIPVKDQDKALKFYTTALGFGAPPFVSNRKLRYEGGKRIACRRSNSATSSSPTGPLVFRNVGMIHQRR